MRTHTLFSTITAKCTLSVLLLSMLQAVLPVLPAHADGPGLIINEIHWAGSALGSNDDWIELHNASDQPWRLTTDPVDMFAQTSGTAPVKIAELRLSTVLTETTIAPGGYFLVGMLPKASSTVNVERDAAFLLPTPADPTIGLADLPGSDVTYTLVDRFTDEVLDTAGTGTGGVPLAGSTCAPAPLADSGCARASMYRLDPAVAGNSAAAWRTAGTVGVGLDPGVEQFGTPSGTSTLPLPAYGNRELSAPSHLAITPLAPTYLDTPTVTGQAQLPASRVRVIFYPVQNPGATPVEITAPILQDGTFTATVSATAPLPAGRYQVRVRAEDMAGNRSRSIIMALPGDAAAYVVNKPTVTLNAYPTDTNKSPLTLTGNTQPGALVTLSLNGVFFASQTVPAGQTAFTFEVPLQPNALNTLTFQAQIGVGNMSDPVTVGIIHDAIAPNNLDATKVTLHSNRPGTDDTVTGAAGAAEAGVLVEVYADHALTQLIASGRAAADGSFGPIAIGDNKYARVYVVASDPAGNHSASVVLDNPITFADSQQTVSVTTPTIGQDRVTLKWEPIPGAVSYRLKYRQVGGGFSNPLELCAVPGETCPFTTTIISLQPGVEYIFAIAGVDRFGNETAYTESRLKTATPPPPPVPAPVSTVAPVTPRGPIGGPVSQATPEPTPTPTPTATPTPAETGEVQSTQDETTARNWTAWIVLGILLALAALATAGYFYWFGGEAGEAALSSVMREREREAEREEEAARRDDKPEKDADDDKKSPPRRSSGREKRW
jgi:hypothetical protein